MSFPSYHVVVVHTRESHQTANAFNDVAKLLKHSFESLGLRCTIGEMTFDRSSINLILGYHLLEGPEALQGLDCIVYQLEQLPGQRGWLALEGSKLEILRSVREVWDFSPRNLELLGSTGVKCAKLVPIGFHDSLLTINRQYQDVDVLFYGAVNARRKAILDALARKCRVKTLFGAYGERRDAWTARSRIVLNLHQYPAMLMEQPRVSYLLNNRRFVVSENSQDNPYVDALVSAPYSEIEDCCHHYLADKSERDRMAQVGFSWFSARPMTEYLLRALA